MPLSFISTRSGNGGVAFGEAVLRGIAPDGGLYMPDQFPMVKSEWRSAADYSSLAAMVLRPWLAGSSVADDLASVVNEALNFQVPLVHISGGDWDDVTVVELFHGPTLSFKDFGARTMAGFMVSVLPADETRTVLVATSGDTGSAVADGFSGQDSIRVVLLYPRGQVSPTQERQLIVRRAGVTTFAVDGTFDDCQRMVKDVFALKGAGGQFTSANSINVGRLLPQMTYYFWAAQHFGGREFLCCVPSGNLGNLTAGLMAHSAGAAASRFIAAHNANDFFPRYLETGEEHFAPSVRTLSNAMDVGVPSNFERIRHMMPEEEIRRLVWGTSVSDETTTGTMQKVFEATGYMADPHTAVGFEAIARYRRDTGDDRPVAIMATAHPAKFPESVSHALGVAPDIPARLAEFWERDTSYSLIGADVRELLDSIA